MCIHVRQLQHFRLSGDAPRHRLSRRLSRLWEGGTPDQFAFPLYAVIADEVFLAALESGRIRTVIPSRLNSIKDLFSSAFILPQ